MDPNNVTALYSKALALLNLGRYEEAVLYFDRALAIDQNFAETLRNKRDALEKLGK